MEEVSVLKRIKFDWRKYVNIRSFGNFAKRHYFDKSKIKESMFTWVAEELPRTLYAYESKQAITLLSGISCTLNHLGNGSDNNIFYILLKYLFR